MSKVEDDSCHTLFKILFEKLSEKDQYNMQINCKVELKKPVWEREHYSPKESLTFHKLPVD